MEKRREAATPKGVWIGGWKGATRKAVWTEQGQRDGKRQGPRIAMEKQRMMC